MQGDGSGLRSFDGLMSLRYSLNNIFDGECMLSDVREGETFGCSKQQQLRIKANFYTTRYHYLLIMYGYIVWLRTNEKRPS